MVKTITIEGLQKVRDLVNDALTKGQNGTGTSSVDDEDTGLETPVAATLKTLTNNTSDRIITTTHTLNTTEGNGLSFTEFENQFSTGESLTRIRHTAINKTNTKEISFVITYELSSD